MTPNEIRVFKGEYAFLSNMYLAPLWWNGKLWRSSEHAYQAAKTLDESEQEEIRACVRPHDTKRKGKFVTMIPEWNSIRVDVMREVVQCKFHQNPKLMELLLATEGMTLIEGNWWHDRFWGVCPYDSNNGSNWLGRILMEVRDEALREQIVEF